jgi:ABC-2 type transport system ATP-binding protein
VLAVRISKSYGRVVAVDGASFSVEPGQLVGLLGPNGAGKSTTVAMIAGLVTPDSGAVTIGGKPLGGDTDPQKRLIGLVPQDLALYEELPAAANLRLFGALYGLTGRALEDAIGSALLLVGSRPGSRQDVQRRHEAPAESRRGHAARPGHRAARRADRGRRSAEPQRHL